MLCPAAAAAAASVWIPPLDFTCGSVLVSQIFTLVTAAAAAFNLSNFFAVQRDISVAAASLLLSFLPLNWTAVIGKQCVCLLPSSPQLLSLGIHLWNSALVICPSFPSSSFLYAGVMHTSIRRIDINSSNDRGEQTVVVVAKTKCGGCCCCPMNISILITEASTPTLESEFRWERRRRRKQEDTA